AGAEGQRLQGDRSGRGMKAAATRRRHVRVEPAAELLLAVGEHGNVAPRDAHGQEATSRFQLEINARRQVAPLVAVRLGLPAWSIVDHPEFDAAINRARAKSDGERLRAVNEDRVQPEVAGKVRGEPEDAVLAAGQLAGAERPLARRLSLAQ